MVKVIVLVIAIFPLICLAQNKPTLKDIPVDVFVNGGNTNVSDLFLTSKETKSKVKILFDEQKLPHELTGINADFQVYWEAFSSQWKWIKFREEDTPLLLFTGLNSYTDEREFVEIYDPELPAPRLFGEPGRLIAFKKHPYTNELILFTHQYPCCRYASHNIYTLRSIGKEIKSKDRFFVGRDAGDMVGPFFPDTVTFEATYKTLEKKTILRWSPKVVQKNAFLERSNTNIIISYNQGAVYKVLAKQGEWRYVIMFNGISEESSAVINHVNFKNKGVYGWIKSER